MNRSAFGAAPGKVILFGEHAVVYGQPAIAVPVTEVRATVTIEASRAGTGLTLVAADLERVTSLARAPDGDPLAAMVRLTLAHLGASTPDAVLTVRSTIPVASGLGSGAAVSTAIVRSLTAYFERELAPEIVSQLVYEVEKLHHGTPSGIDNTVVAYGMPVYFEKGKQIETFGAGTALWLLIADTGIASPTRVAVGDVRRGWERDVRRYDNHFRRMGDIARKARNLIVAGGNNARIGELMDLNHQLLREIDVSSVEIEHLVTAARGAGALGAKLSGAGRGGNVIALVRPADSKRISGALRQSGAVRVIETAVSA
jgi:mevalonate kinase